MNTLYQDKIVTVLGLLIKCPLDEPLDDCPTNKYRDLPFNEKYTLARNMKLGELDDIINQHKKCIKLREMELFGHTSL